MSRYYLSSSEHARLPFFNRSTTHHNANRARATKHVRSIRSAVPVSKVQVSRSKSGPSSHNVPISCPARLAAGPRKKTLFREAASFTFSTTESTRPPIDFGPIIEIETKQLHRPEIARLQLEHHQNVYSQAETVTPRRHRNSNASMIVHPPTPQEASFNSTPSMDVDTLDQDEQHEVGMIYSEQPSQRTFRRLSLNLPTGPTLLEELDHVITEDVSDRRGFRQAIPNAIAIAEKGLQGHLDQVRQP